MKLLTKEISRMLPTIEVAGNTDDPPVFLKFFTPDAGWSWYVIGADACLGWSNAGGESWSEFMSLKDFEAKYGDMKIGDTKVVDGEQFELEDIRFTGYVKGLEDECGDFAMSELLTVKGKLGLPIERDRWWTTVPLSLVMEGKTN